MSRWCILVIITKLSSFGRAEARTIEHFSICYLLTYFFTKLKTKRNRRKSFSTSESIAWEVGVLTTRLRPTLISIKCKMHSKKSRTTSARVRTARIKVACMKITSKNSNLPEFAREILFNVSFSYHWLFNEHNFSI